MEGYTIMYIYTFCSTKFVRKIDVRLLEHLPELTEDYLMKHIYLSIINTEVMINM